MIYTYIIRTRKGEYYCGKTNNIQKRMKQHVNEKSPKWFGQYKNRKDFHLIHRFKGDWEKFIKRGGVKKISNLIFDEITIEIPAP